MNFSAFNSIGIVIAALVAIPFAVIAIFFFVGAMRSRRQVSESQNWPTTNGKVIFSTVETSHSHNHGHTTTAYYPKVTYEYTINGQRYQSTHMNFGSAIGTSNYNSVLQKAATYPINRVVQVYYNPDDPSQAVLEKDAPSSRLFILVAVFIVAVVGCTLVATLGSNFFINGMLSKFLPQVFH